MKPLYLSLLLSLFSVQAETLTPYATPEEVPQSATALWAEFDARKEPLEIKVVKEWKEDGVVMRLVTFKIGTFKGTESRLAAYYCFPEGGEKHPAFVWTHGGGQRANRSRGKYFAAQGYATLDINWGGRELADDLGKNTDWGKIDATQGPGFYKKSVRTSWKRSLEPDEHSVDSIPSPRNNNWYLCSLAARRAITFLEQQPEVNADKIGYSGFSMGGTITSMTAPDPRLKAVAPFVGGTAFIDEDFPGLERSGNGFAYKHLDLYRKTIDPAAYWPSVKIPVMFITSSNDFHAAYERIQRSMDLLPHKNWRISSYMHNNHGPSPEQWVTLNLWFDHYLKGEPLLLPATPPSDFKIAGELAHFNVTPENTGNLKNVEIYYSYDPNARARFWHRHPSSEPQGKTWHATFSVKEGLPLYAFALCRYELPAEKSLEVGATKTFSINSQEYMHIPEKVDLSKLSLLAHTEVLEDFSHGSQDWMFAHGKLSTYKLQSPYLHRDKDRKMKITFNLEEGTPLLLGLNVGSSFYKKGQDLGNYFYGTKVAGNGAHSITLSRADFKQANKKEGEPDVLLEWEKMTNFGISLREENGNKALNLSNSADQKVIQKIELIR